MASTDEIRAKLSASYNQVLPLLDYLKARLKYDTVRWLRTYGTKDDIVFSTRVKTFARTYDKLNRKGVSLTPKTDVLNLALNGKGILDDLIGIRFICFDSYTIYKLISYFLITERVITSNREYYISSRAKQDTPLSRFLQSNGFKAVQKEGREYEDINFIIRFSHPIDRYFNSGLDQFQSLALRAESSASKNEKLQRLNEMFDKLRSDYPSLIREIPNFPIECQIVTASQHIYNRTQRPHYEYIVQRKEDDLAVADAEVHELNLSLELLKLNLLASDQAAYTIHQKYGIRYQAPLQITPGRMFQLEGRFPKDVLEIKDEFSSINVLVNKIIDPLTTTHDRQKNCREIFRFFEAVEKKIADRASKVGDISSHNLLVVADLEDLSDGEILFWCYQRVVFLVLSTLLIYAPDPTISKRILSELRFASRLGEPRARGSFSLADTDIAIGRLFEKLEHIDNAILSKLSSEPSSLLHRSGRLYNLGLFSDPLIQWRYASHMYSRREYANALQEIKVGISVHERLRALDENDREAARFQVPELPLFHRRLVEYDVCLEVTRLKYNTSTVAGIAEFCNAVAARHSDWNARLVSSMNDGPDVAEEARCLTWLVMLEVAAVTAGGLHGTELDEVHRKFGERFSQIERRLESGERHFVSERSWWLLTKSVMRPQGAAQSLERAKRAIKNVAHHPIERKQLEEVFATLIELWVSTSGTIKSRSEFTGDILLLLKEQADRLTRSEVIGQVAIDQSREIASLLKKIQQELSAKNNPVLKEETKAKAARLIAHTTEQFAIEVVVSGLRSIMGL